MAPSLRVLCLLFVCVSIVVTVETKYSKATAKPHSTRKPVHTPKPPAHEIQKKDKYRDVHATQHGYPQSTQPPRTVKPGYNPYPQAPKPTQAPYDKRQQEKPPQAGRGHNTTNQQQRPGGNNSHSYPDSNGQSGGGFKSTTQKPWYPNPNGGGRLGSGHNTTNQQQRPGGNNSHSYPDSNGQSGGGFKTTTTTQKPWYPNPNGGGRLGSGHNTTNQQQRPGGNNSHSYPDSNGQSGGGFKTTTTTQKPWYPDPNGGGRLGSGRNTTSQQQRPGGNNSHSYPESNGQSGAGFKPTRQKPGKVHIPNQQVQVIHTQTSPNQIYVRGRHTTHIYHDNSPIIIHHYHYRPPTYVYYVGSNGKNYHYPVYRENLPQYVYDYMSSKSRFNVVLTGLALYNLGHLSKNRETHNFHNKYKPGPIEVCKFGVKYDTGKYQEMDIDCRLMTNFIWTVRNANKNQMSSNLIQRLYPNGTLIAPEVTNISFVNQRLYPNGTLAFPQLVWNADSDVVVDALDPRFNGPPIRITKSMNCYMKYFDGYILTAPVSKYVPCGVLQAYVKTSFSSARRIVASLLPIVISIVVAVFNS